MKYYVMALASSDDYAEINNHPEDLPIEEYYFDEARPLLSQIPEKLNYQFTAEKPDGRELVDLQFNTLGLFIVSPKLKQLLEGHANIEFIPIIINDHRGGVASEEYCIANFLDVCDCIDLDKSKCRVSPFNKDKFNRISKLVIDESKITTQAKIFRIQQVPTTLVVTDSLVNILKNNNISGAQFVPVEEYDSAYFIGV